MAEFELIGVKEAAEVRQGDFVTLTGYADNIAEVEEVYPVDNMIAVNTADGAGRVLNPAKRLRVYA